MIGSLFSSRINDRGGFRRSRLGELGRFWRLRWSGPQSPEVCAAVEADDFWVKNYLENGPKLQKMQKIYIKMFG